MIVGMLDYALSPDQLAELRQAYRRTRDKREARPHQGCGVAGDRLDGRGSGGSFAGRSQYGARALQALWYKVGLRHVGDGVGGKQCCRRLGYVYKKPRLVPGKADREA